MLELSSLPSPSSLVGGINLPLAINSAPRLGCGFGTVQNVVAVLAKPSNTDLPLLFPLAGATVYVNVYGAATKSFITNQLGVTSIGCFSFATPQGYSIKVSHPTVDFGKGYGYPGIGIYRSALELAKPIIVQGDTYLSCMSPKSISIIAPTSLPSPASILKISTPQISFGFPGYGTIFPTNLSPANYSIQIDGKEVASGTVGDSRTVDVDFGSILSMPALKSLLGKSNINIKVIVSFAGCTKEGNAAINFPLECSRFITQIDSLTTPPSILPGTPLLVSMAGIKQVCSDNPDITKILDNVKGTISLGNLSSVPFTISNGNAVIDLAKIFPITSLFR